MKLLAAAMIASFLCCRTAPALAAENALPTVSISESEMSVRRELNELASRGIPVFYSGCKKTAVVSTQHLSPPGSTAILIFPVGERKGLLIEQAADGTANNVAAITIRQGRLAVEETQGGAWSYERMGRLVREVARTGFKLVEPNELVSIRGAKLEKKCVDRPPRGDDE